MYNIISRYIRYVLSFIIKRQNTDERISTFRILEGMLKRMYYVDKEVAYLNYIYQLRVFLNEKKGQIQKSPPGGGYIIFAKILLTRKSYIKIMEPSILMMQEEYFSYYQQGKLRFALWVKIRFIFIFIFILGLNFPLVKQLLEIKEKLAK